MIAIFAYGVTSTAGYVSEVLRPLPKETAYPLLLVFAGLPLGCVGVLVPIGVALAVAGIIHTSHPRTVPVLGLVLNLLMGTIGWLGPYFIETGDKTDTQVVGSCCQQTTGVAYS